MLNQFHWIFTLIKTFLTKIHFLFPYIALISAFAAQMALLEFIFPLFISPGTCHLMVEDYSRACQRERERKEERRRRRRRKKKKAQKKPLCCDRGLNSRTLSTEPSVLSVRPRCLAKSSATLVSRSLERMLLLRLRF